MGVTFFMESASSGEHMKILDTFREFLEELNSCLEKVVKDLEKKGSFQQVQVEKRQISFVITKLTEIRCRPKKIENEDDWSLAFTLKKSPDELPPEPICQKKLAEEAGKVKPSANWFQLCWEEILEQIVALSSNQENQVVLSKNSQAGR